MGVQISPRAPEVSLFLCFTKHMLFFFRTFLITRYIAMTESGEELEAKAIIEARGFLYRPDHDPNSSYAWMRFCYSDPTAPVATGGAVGFGQTRRQAALNMIGCLPRKQARITPAGIHPLISRGFYFG